MFKKCKHEQRRCVHGDEVLYTIRFWGRIKIARVACIQCGKYLYNGKLLRICSVSGHPHIKRSPLAVRTQELPVHPSAETRRLRRVQ